MQLRAEWVSRFVEACAQIRSAKRRTFADHELIYLGIPAGTCYIIRSGYVKVLDSGTEGEQFVRLIVGRGGLVGDRPFSCAAFGGFTVPQFEQAVAHGPVELMELACADVETTARSRIEFAKLLIESATTLTQFLERRLRWQFISPVRTRLAIVLRDLLCFEGQRCRHGHSVDIRLTHQDLAELIVAARPVVSAELARLRDEGVVSYTRSYFCVDDLSSLKEVVGD